MITVYLLILVSNGQLISEFADKTDCEIYRQYWDAPAEVACVPARRARTGRGHEREKP